MSVAPNPKRTVMQLAGVILFMGGMAWASVPLYDLFCRVTGYGGTPLVSEQGADAVLDKTVTVRFDASKERDMPWEFKPVQRKMDVKIGETGLAFYEAYNPTDRPIAGSAAFNVAPYAAGGYFTKIDCFCFTEQVLQPGERVQMPVTFYVDPAIVDDDEGKFVHTITLSYTFHQIELPEELAQTDAAVDLTGPRTATQ
ncbi:cytochrome C oxidase assembly protein [Actibacterium mucosum KCTC 23349]|uniref:Cytochrome c oxidase assembly protein CtaG n=1 Tax=Actibacterium mucosum KCTC 23349 TaxID=1454373 RepID=A0A037ZHV1_9RHOB|nr:cytochrome c oxidase assembly protein [Actibacterium mucosum]KAJ56015.1 cytochrome C oxidase assembly protein [Actibacterium mucosum KCTC 23349]